MRVKLSGIETILFDHDKFVCDNKLSIQKYPEGMVVLRGWMLSDIQYRKLYVSLYKKGGELINNPVQYTHCHYFPNVLQDIKKFTVDTKWWEDKLMCDELLETIHKDIDKDYIIKDFVKSEKGTDLFRLNKDLSFDEFKKFIYDFKDARQPLFEHGYVLKEFVNIENEYRVFVLNNEIISVEQNSNQLEETCKPDDEFMNNVKSRITRNKFYTIDFAQVDGKWIVMECGDGQVSGLSPKQNEFEFYKNFINE